eukprot:CAMPEP_0179286692 /NCGR_PEP_ID=MMETSP0797-20121207/39877_1 /TAXON_ID=47934 /ORGANISM="Dinophysis acuminata, Strain DAEP01" /LENGTH=216 /DNA_ID=CAMNT_0020995593 /DNA_START=66 /DNA_END=712 /DNA_ORIENTATION=-
MTADLAGSGDRYLDGDSFRHFTPLLHVSRAYTRLSGFRFHGRSFECISTDAYDGHSQELQEEQEDELIAAKLAALPAVREFEGRLQSGEAELLEEVDRAFRLVMTESVRNSMIATCKELGMFPPSPPPSGVEDEDCSYEDVSARFEVVAQRLYNDQARRCCSGDLGGRLVRRALTASFIVDFAAASGVPAPAMPEALHLMLQEFLARAAEWAAPRG